MKKWLIRLLLALVVLLILAGVALSFFLDSAIKHGVETVGPMLTKVEVKLDAVSLSLLSGSGKIQGLLVGNPQGFKTPSAIQVGQASLSLQPGSVFADKVVIKSINVQAPEITFETDLKSNNLKRILANLEETTGGGQKSQTADPATQKKASRKLQVDEFAITGAKVHVGVTALGSTEATVTLPDIHLTDLGQGPDGITAADLTRKVLQVIEAKAAEVAAGAITDNLTKGARATGTGAVNTLTKDLGGLLKKK
jgi:hypothetical protein